MTTSYFIRLLYLALAAFFLVHLALGLAMWTLAPTAARLATRLKTRIAARLFFAMRVLPAVGGLLVAAGICVPSYLTFEPDTSAEEIGVACLAAAILGAAVLFASILRALRAAFASFRFARRCERAAHQMPAFGAFPSMRVVERNAPIFALSGIVKPCLLVSRNVLDALSEDQFAAALRHEQAHGSSRDNLKRLLMMLSPDIFPFVRAFRSIERSWAKFSEWAADDCAVDGDSRRSLSLAAALVRVARLGSPRRPELASSLLADGDDLAVRVNRLLHEPPIALQNKQPGRTMIVGLAFAALLIAAIMQPATLRAVHLLLERLMD